MVLVLVLALVLVLVLVPLALVAYGYPATVWPIISNPLFTTSVAKPIPFKSIRGQNIT